MRFDIDFRELQLPIGMTSFPIMIGYNHPVTSDLIFENPFLKLESGKIIEVTPKQLVITKGNLMTFF